MPQLQELDFFTDTGVSDDPYPWIEAMRGQGAVTTEPHHNSVVVTGFPETVEIYSRPDDFSNVACVGGPLVPLPFEPQGDDITDQIEAHRRSFVFSDHFITFDGPLHKAHRSIMTKLLTYRRLKSNEEFMQRFTGELIAHFKEKDRCELMSEYAQPFSTWVIADLLGVPEEDRAELVASILPAPGTMDTDEGNRGADPFADFEATFTSYLEERRRSPRDDMLTDLANSKLPDGSDPGTPALVRVASFLFIAGQDTSAKLLTSCVRFLAEQPELQCELRADRSKIPLLIEEVLRVESPSKTDFRLTRRTSTIGGVEIKAGSIVMMNLAGVNRDPRQFERPDQFDIYRKNVRDHVSFGRGPHACPGAPLARLEARVGIERLFDHFGEISLDKEKHGSHGDPQYSYLRSFILRGLDELHLRLA